MPSISTTSPRATIGSENLSRNLSKPKNPVTSESAANNSTTAFMVEVELKHTTIKYATAENIVIPVIIPGESRDEISLDLPLDTEPLDFTLT